jgi:type I restriction enzyme, S subunit
MLNLSLLELSESITSGLTPLRSNDEFWNNGIIPWLKTEQLGEKYIFDTNEFISQKALDETSIKLNKENTLSIAMYGEGRTRGSVSILKNKMTTNQACCNVYLDDTKADYEYVYYFLKTQYDNLRSLSSGVRKNLNSNDIKNFKINIPKDIEEQKKIANVLSSLDSKIELNNKINKELESMAKILYDYWCVQFDFPEENGKPYKSSGGKMVYSQELKREIPEGWGVENLEEICEIYQPQTISEKEMIKDGKYFVFGANGIVGMYDKYNHENSEVTITCRGNSCGTLNRTLPYSWITGNAMVVRFKDDKIHNEYLMHFLSWTKMDNVITGSAQPQITRTNLAPLKILIPETNILDSFTQKMEFNVNLQLKNIEQNQELTKLRDWLLPMLMNGQVRVK